MSYGMQMATQKLRIYVGQVHPFVAKTHLHPGVPAATMMEGASRPENIEDSVAHIEAVQQRNRTLGQSNTPTSSQPSLVADMSNSQYQGTLLASEIPGNRAMIEDNLGMDGSSQPAVVFNGVGQQVGGRKLQQGMSSMFTPTSKAASTEAARRATPLESVNTANPQPSLVAEMSNSQLQSTLLATETPGNSAKIEDNLGMNGGSAVVFNGAGQRVGGRKLQQSKPLASTTKSASTEATKTAVPLESVKTASSQPSLVADMSNSQLQGTLLASETPGNRAKIEDNLGMDGSSQPAVVFNGAGQQVGGRKLQQGMSSMFTPTSKAASTEAARRATPLESVNTANPQPSLVAEMSNSQLQSTLLATETPGNSAKIEDNLGMNGGSAVVFNGAGQRVGGRKLQQSKPLASTTKSASTEATKTAVPLESVKTASSQPSLVADMSNSQLQGTLLASETPGNRAKIEDNLGMDGSSAPAVVFNGAGQQVGGRKIYRA
jgi:hypothetical protein